MQQLPGLQIDGRLLVVIVLIYNVFVLVREQNPFTRQESEHHCDRKHSQQSNYLSDEGLGFHDDRHDLGSRLKVNSSSGDRPSREHGKGDDDLLKAGGYQEQEKSNVAGVWC